MLPNLPDHLKRRAIVSRFKIVPVQDVPALVQTVEFVVEHSRPPLPESRDNSTLRERNIALHPT